MWKVRAPGEHARVNERGRKSIHGSHRDDMHRIFLCLQLTPAAFLSPTVYTILQILQPPYSFLLPDPSIPTPCNLHPFAPRSIRDRSHASSGSLSLCVLSFFTKSAHSWDVR